MRSWMAVSAAWVLCVASSTHAAVFISKALINPPGANDPREFIEIMGTPGMKLDGYALALINGAQQKTYPLGTIPPRPEDHHEIDELFALDGYTLGANGILILVKGLPSNYAPAILSDTTTLSWDLDDVWNGDNAVDGPSGLENDGSNTLMLIRNRPGDTPANCAVGPCDDTRWRKDGRMDDELTVLPVGDPPVDMQQYGNGNLDTADALNADGFTTLDFKGKSTPLDITDDLEIVDEVAYEHDQGWEFDEDDRSVDVGSTTGSLKQRRVHNIGDPAGYNPDCLVRVDYRTKGPGWAPIAGGTGQMPNGNNWQDTASEQWIRGDLLGSSPYNFDNNANADVNIVPNQPYRTQVPLWLNDGVAPDYSFALNSYQLTPGRVNQLAIPYIPGDTDRDGICSAADIAKTAAVFGNDNWIFSNSYEAAPESDSGDPATQTRPWDVDATGDNGIEASDLQWTLNFQGNTDGRIVGVRYDSTTPSATGVYLNPNTGVACTVTATAVVPSGHPLSALTTCDTVELTVRAAVTAGAQAAAGQENGVMQFVHDVALSTAGVLHVISVQPLGAFTATRASLSSFRGTGGDQGVDRVNGFTTGFSQGLSGPADLYRITLAPVGVGSTSLSIAPAAMAKFAASTPHGLKVGHTASNGNPASATYPAALAITVVSSGIQGDVDGSSVVNASDIPPLVNVLLGIDTDAGRVARSDVNCDGTANGRDIQPFVNILTGP